MFAHVIMGDVTSSRNFSGRAVQEYLQEAVDHANSGKPSDILSPLTVTLGDEFQGIARDFRTLCELVFRLQHWRLEKHVPFELHYSLVRGELDTDINPDIAHGMLGQALSRARQLVSSKVRNRPRYNIDTGNMTTTMMMNELFLVLEGLENRWSRKDDNVISTLLKHSNDAEAGDILDKDRSQIWKRRGTLLIEEYRNVQGVIMRLADLVDNGGRLRDWHDD